MAMGPAGVPGRPSCTARYPLRSGADGVGPEQPTDAPDPCMTAAASSTGWSRGRVGRPGHVSADTEVEHAHGLMADDVQVAAPWGAQQHAGLAHTLPRPQQCGRGTLQDGTPASSQAPECSRGEQPRGWGHAARWHMAYRPSPLGIHGIGENTWGSMPWRYNAWYAAWDVRWWQRPMGRTRIAGTATWRFHACHAAWSEVPLRCSDTCAAGARWRQRPAGYAGMMCTMGVALHTSSMTRTGRPRCRWRQRPEGRPGITGTTTPADGSGPW